MGALWNSMPYLPAWTWKNSLCSCEWKHHRADFCSKPSFSDYSWIDSTPTKTRTSARARRCGHLAHPSSPADHTEIFQTGDGLTKLESLLLLLSPLSWLCLCTQLVAWLKYTAQKEDQCAYCQVVAEKVNQREDMRIWHIELSSWKSNVLNDASGTFIVSVHS